VITVCQVALSTLDLERTHAWYRRMFGLLQAAGPRHAEGEKYGRVSGLGDVSFDVWWLVDAQPNFQLELFQFQRPPMTPLRVDHRRSDVGYTTIGIHMFDLDAALARLRAEGTQIATITGSLGNRRVTLRDPDGVWLELFEQDLLAAPQPRAWPEAGAVVRMISLSVPDLDRALAFWTSTLGLMSADNLRVRDSAHENEPSRTAILRSGDILIELLEFAAPRPRPPGYRISDQGILNVALRAPDRASLDDAYQRALNAGYRALSEPSHVPGLATVVYLVDDQDFSVELLHVESPERMGFVPQPA
jgi:catechol 2,3-dioxygenase-like lactoylglutathione lyase family enzyme